MDLDGISYQQFRTWLLQGQEDGASTQGPYPWSPLAYEFDSWSRVMLTDRQAYATTVIVLSIIGVRQGFLPGFLAALVDRLPDITDLLTPDEHVVYRDDLATLTVLRRYVPYQVHDTGAFHDEVQALLIQWPYTQQVGGSV